LQDDGDLQLVVIEYLDKVQQCLQSYQMQVSPVEPIAEISPVEEIKEAEIDQSHEIIVRRKKKDTRHFKKKVFEPLKPKETPKEEISSFFKLD
jgi:hypothetical protein